MIQGTVSSRSCFRWRLELLHFVCKDIFNLILVLTIWWCPCVKSSLVLLEEGVCYDQCILLENSISLCPASFRIPRPNLPVTPGISWLPTFSFHSLSRENLIKDLLSMAPPIRTRPRFPHSQSLPSGSFYKPLILLHQGADRMKATITEN